MAELIEIEVVCALPDRQAVVRLEVPEGTQLIVRGRATRALAWLLVEARKHRPFVGALPSEAANLLVELGRRRDASGLDRCRRDHRRVRGHALSRRVDGGARLMPAARGARRARRTKETDVRLRFALDGTGKASVRTGLRFLDHMLELFTVHGLFDLSVKAAGDLDVDQHHTVEDLGLVLGAAIDDALGDRKGLVRYASVEVPMDECLVAVAIDLGGRPYFAHDLRPKTRIVGEFDSTLVPDFFTALTQGARCTVHVRQIRGGNTHHLLEATFKAFGRALDAASRRDPRRRGVPSSKGRIG